MLLPVSPSFKLSLRRVKMLRNSVSKKSVISISLGLLAVAVLAAMTLPLMPRAAHAAERSGELHVTKDCSADTNDAGAYCTIESSNLGELVGAKVFYTQAALPPATPEGGYIALDSNVVLYVGTGDWVVGRCTLDLNGSGLCMLSDGTGKFTGFHARVAVSYTPTAADPYLFTWDGKYRFSPEPDR
jgi:hypothetical protein